MEQRQQGEQGDEGAGDGFVYMGGGGKFFPETGQQW